MTTKTPKQPEQDQVTSAQQALDATIAALEAERRRIQDTKDQVVAITKAIEGTDPDDVGAFADLVRERDTLRGLLEALAIREAKAAAAVAAAEIAVAETRRAELVAEAERLEAEIAAADAACTAEAEAAEARLTEQLRALRSLVERRRAIEASRQGSGMRDGIQIATMTFGSAWSAVPDSEVASSALRNIRWQRTNRMVTSGLLGGA